MIKFFVLCALLQLALGQQHCTSDSDCAAGECCVTSILGKRRRFVFDDLFGGQQGGTCKALAQEGHTCEPDMLTFGGSRAHSFGCPCDNGLECHGEQESHQGGSHSYTNPKCMPAGTYTGGTGTGSQTGSSANGNTPISGGSVETTQRPAVTEAPMVDPHQPIEELPGK